MKGSPELGQMDEQQGVCDEVVDELLDSIQAEQMKVGEQILQLIEQQTPIVLCGGAGGECHDVTICLVPSGINWKIDEPDHYREILAVFKVHSSHLIRCSKYFETCLAEQWTSPSSTLMLETHADVACYIDCFSRMYTPPFHKDFKDVKHCLGLLKVASQIQFQELMDSVFLFLSSKVWLDTDEVMIRAYTASPDFPRKHAQDLVARLGMDESKKECHKQLCAVVEQCTRTALGHDGSFRSNRAIIRELLPVSALCNGSPSADSHITRDVVIIVCREAKCMLVKLGQECDGQTYLSVARFADKMSAICWILETLLASKVAEEVVGCFVQILAFPKVIAIDSPRAMTGFENHSQYQESTKAQRIARDAAMELVKLVVVMYREVAAGNLLLKTPERVALLENWHSLLGKFLSRDKIDQATKDLFSTLPLKQQMELIKCRFNDGNYEDYINTNSLGNLLKRKWPAMDVKCVVSSSQSGSSALPVSDFERLGAGVVFDFERMGVAGPNYFENLPFHSPDC